MTPLEIWDLVVGDRTLFAARARRDFGTRLASAVVRLQRQLDFDEVLVGGGGADARVLSTLNARIPARALPDGRFVAMRGGLAMADLVVDVGQTAVKVAWPRGRVLVEMRSPVESVKEALALAPSFDRVVLGLPAALDDHGTPGPCSLSIGPTFVRDVIPTGGVLLLNDAELAAETARSVATVKSLVLTIGFGVGAALLDPRAPSV